MLLVSSSEDDLSSSSNEGSEGGNPGVQDIIKWTLSDSEEDDTGSEQHSEPRDSVLPHRTATSLEWLTSDSRLRPTLSSIEMAITHLYRISVRESATYNRLKRYEKPDSREFDIYLHFDRQFVRDAFPTANDSLVSRLGKLVTERRRILRYRQLYNEELQRAVVSSKQSGRLQQSSHTVPVVLPNESTANDLDNYTEKQPRTFPKSSLKATTFHPNDLQSPSTDHLLSSTISEADEASSTAPTEAEGSLLIPVRPKDSQGQETFDFVCPYCGVFKNT